MAWPCFTLTWVFLVTTKMIILNSRKHAYLGLIFATTTFLSCLSLTMFRPYVTWLFLVANHPHLLKHAFLRLVFIATTRLLMYSSRCWMMSMHQSKRHASCVDQVLSCRPANEPPTHCVLGLSYNEWQEKFNVGAPHLGQSLATCYTSAAASRRVAEHPVTWEKGI